MRRARSMALLFAVVVLIVTPGCLMGSPAAAVAGEPYGMVVDDVKALQGKKGPIWAAAPVMAAFDLPLAACLDTAFLPIALIVWAIKALAGADDDENADRDASVQPRAGHGVSTEEPRRRDRPAERELVPE